MALHWQETAYGFAAAGFRIRRLDGSGARWQLEVAPHRMSTRPDSAVATTLHLRLKEARRRAEALEAERSRRRLISGHIIAGVVAAIVFAINASTVTGISLFVTTVLTGYLTLRSFVSAISLTVGHAWNWTRDDGVGRELSRWDRIVQRGMTALEGAPDWSTPVADDTAVMVVRPFDERHPFSRRPSR